jgi:hypothetical protein
MSGQTIANPGNAQARMGFESTDCGLGDATTLRDFRMRSEGLGAELPLIEDDSIGPFGEEPEGEPSKIDPGGPINVNWMGEDHGQHLAAFFGKGATPVQAPAGVFLHKLAVTETDVSFGRVVVEISRDQGRPTFYTGGIPSQLSFALQGRGILNGSITYVFPRFHFFDDPSVLAGVGPIPFLRGLQPVAQLDSAVHDDSDVFVQVTAVPGTGGADFDVKAKVGLATTYDGAAIPIFVGNDTAGNPLFTVLLHTATDVHVGQNAELPIEIHYKDAAAVAVLDEHRFPHRRVDGSGNPWTQALPVKALFNEISAFIRVDGIERRIRQMTGTLTRPVELDEAIGGRFTDFTIEQGDRTSVLELTRRAIGLELQNRLLAGAPFEFELDALSTEIAATGVRRRLRWISKLCRATGRTISIAGKTTFDEPLTFKCHPSTDGTYPSAVTIELTNSTSDLNP